MNKAYWTGWGIASGISYLLFAPVGIIMALISLIIVPAVKRGKRQVAIEAKVDLLAKQAGIQYGTTEEKLEQIATGRAKATYDTRDPWDRT